MSFRIPWAVLLCVALTIVSAFAEEEESGNEDSPKEPKEEKVTKLNGMSLFGIVEVTDDYTVRVKSDSGIQNIPIAMLGEKDFKKFSSKKDRSEDGKLWSERKDALEGEKKNNKSDKDDAAIEINLKEIAPLQPLIDAYDKSLADKKKDEDQEKEKTEKSEETPGRSLFSKTGIPGLGNQPFTGMATSLAEPAVSTGGTVIQSTTGILGGGLPKAP